MPVSYAISKKVCKRWREFASKTVRQKEESNQPWIFFAIFSHNDFAFGIRQLMQNNITALDFNSNLSASEPWASYPHDHTDLPRLREGRVGGQVI